MESADIIHSVSGEEKTIRQAKDSVILSIGLVSREAMKVGVDTDFCMHMAQMFTDKVEASYSLKELAEIRYQTLLFYTKKVESLTMKGVKSPIVLHMIKYINDNIENHISCQDISKALKIHRSYASDCFKKETGIGLIDYINRQKILLAKQLLKFTDKSLTDISYQLSFSSQAYFTKVFKDVVGITPLEYKESFLE
jgi:YesN/AraC family two-component response regulator